MRDHTVLVGFGVTGVGAAQQLLRAGARPEDLVVLDVLPSAVRRAEELGLPACQGDGMTHATLRGLTSERTRSVLVTAGPDTTAVMITMIARGMCPTATVVTAVRDVEHIPYARKVGADEVIAMSEWTGRALALVLAAGRFN